MDNAILEYIWLDGYETQNLRSKVKVLSDWDGTLSGLPIWNFDGSSTKQATGNDSECILQPVRIYQYYKNHYFVLCEVFNSNMTPHITNSRSLLRKNISSYNDSGFWWGFEQEYFVTKSSRPLGFPPIGLPDPQGLYYCGVGGNQVKGRLFAEHHLHTCLGMGITLTGINAEVALGQWEYQCFAEDTLKVCDDLWMSRYVLYRLAEEEDWDIDISPKPVAGDWNGSGCHANFSTSHMRDVGGEEYFVNLMNRFSTNHTSHIDGYGKNNHLRLTGEHETQHIDTFSWGVADRGASIRVPNSTIAAGWAGYLEDRRPSANCDPYVVAKLIANTTLEI